jgi:hypothetical protein
MLKIDDSEKLDINLNPIPDKCFLTEGENLMENHFLEVSVFYKLETGLPMNIWTDDFGCGRKMKHNTPRIKFQKTCKDEVLEEEMLPISISDDPSILIKGNAYMEINKSDLDILKKWIKKYKVPLFQEWNQDITVWDLQKIIRLPIKKGKPAPLPAECFLTEQENLRENRLLEMSNLHKSDTGLPMNLWIDKAGIGRSVEHNTPRIKFQRTYKNNIDEDEMIPISISDSPKILLKNKNKKLIEISSHDLKILEDWIVKYKVFLMQVWNETISLDDFKRILK